MKKPKLEDFNLTDKSRDLYDQQISQYYKIQEKIGRECDKRNKIVIIACCVPTIILFILFIVFTSKSNNTGEGSTVFCLFLLFATIACPCVVAKLFYISDYPLSEFEKTKRENFENSLGIITNKYKYVDKLLEENLHNYDHAILEYNDYQLKLSIDFWTNLNGYQF